MEKTGSSSNGRTPDLHSGNEGSTPSVVHQNKEKEELEHVMKSLCRPHYFWVYLKKGTYRYEVSDDGFIVGFNWRKRND